MKTNSNNLLNNLRSALAVFGSQATRYAPAVALICALGCTTCTALTTNFTFSGTWTCPTGVTNVSVECWGGGGAGGSVTNVGSGTSSSSTVGGGGAGGAYAIKTNITVIPGNSYTVTVGAGGTPPALPPADGAQGNGGDSWFIDTVTVLAKGGEGGFSRSATRPAQGNGGSCPAGSVGDASNLGGSGANGDGSVGVQAAGGGGGSGGTSNLGLNGGSPNIQSGATAVAGGGAGGNGKQGTSGPGIAGGSPGGGGGGAAASAANSSQLGGAGAVGKVAITYSIPAATYSWVATSGAADWTAAASWSPSRTSPAINDVLLFNQGGSSTASNVTTETIGKLQVANSTTIVLTPAGLANTLTISETAADALTVGANSQLNVTATTDSTNLTIHAASGAKGSISGSMSFFDSLVSATSFTLTAADASGITFNSGAQFTQDCAGNAFGSGTANSVVFSSGSTFIEKFGNNPFQKSQPASVVVFQPGSLFSVQGNFQPSASGRTYADLEINYATFSQTVSGAAQLTVSNLSVLQGALGVSMSGGLNLMGNAAVAPDATLNLNNTVATASGKTITINGRLGGTGNVSGGAAIAISATGTLAPGTSGIGTLTLPTAPTMAGTNLMEIDRNGFLSDLLAVSSGTLGYGGVLAVENVGAALQVGDSFTLFTAPSHIGNFTSIVGDPGSGLAYSFTNGVLSVVSSTSPTPVSLSILAFGSNAIVSWTDPTGLFKLVTGTNLTGITNVVASSSPYTNAISGQRYYRLVYP